MAKSLKFNSQGFADAYKKQLIVVCNEIGYTMYNHIVRNLGSSDAKGDVDIEEATNIVDGVIQTCIVSGWKAVLDSYGIGKGIDTDSLHFKDYKASKYWNTDRNGTAIVGRASGKYTNIFGEQESSGSMEGVELGFYLNATKAIQMEESDWFSGDKVSQTIDTVMTLWINQNLSKYFVYS